MHALPPGVVTRDLFEAVESATTPTDVRLCRDCVDRLVAGEPVAAVVPALDRGG